MLRTPMLAGSAAIGSACLAAAGLARLRSTRPELVHSDTAFHRAVLERCPTLNGVYKLIPFLSGNGHIETILASRLRGSPVLNYDRDLLRLPDGGTVALDFEALEEDLPPDAPVLILLPGLTGGSHDTYVKHMVHDARQHGLRAVVFNSRGTSDGPVTTPQFYSASYTGDMRAVVAAVQRRYPRSTLLAAGWSLGANILVRYLGEEGSSTPIQYAVSMANPFNLVISDENFKKGFNRIYDTNLAKSLRNIYNRHAALFDDLGGEYQPSLAANCRTIRDFDDAITRVSFGWPSVDAYYAGSGSDQSIPNVSIPLLCIQAADDPIAPKNAIPVTAIRANPLCLLAITPAGGHLGWCSGPGAPFGAPWADEAALEWLDSALLERAAAPQDSKSAMHALT